MAHKINAIKCINYALTGMTLSLEVFLVQPSPKQSEYIASRATSTNSHTREVSSMMRHVCILILLRNILHVNFYSSMPQTVHDNLATESRTLVLGNLAISHTSHKTMHKKPAILDLR